MYAIYESQSIDLKKITRYVVIKNMMLIYI